MSERTDRLRERAREKDPDALEATEAFEPIFIHRISSTEINSESLKEKGFYCWNHRYKLNLFSKRLELTNPASCTDLVWEEEKGLYLE